MAGIKIVDLPALGRDLISTDLLELSLAGGTGSRKITGQEIMNASKLSVGNTPIINGAVGQVLFQGTGNVLQESANFFWDNTNNRLGIGVSSPAQKLSIVGNNTIMFTGVSPQNQASFVGTDSSDNFYAYTAGQGSGKSGYYGVSSGTHMRTTANSLDLAVGNGAPILGLRLNTTGNILIGTTTDAGFKLDVNGTARFKDTGSAASIIMQYGTGGWIAVNNAGGTEAIRLRGGGGPSYFNTGQNVLIGTTTDDIYKLDVNGTARVSGNVLLTSGIVATSGETTRLQSVLNFFSHNRLASSGVFGWDIRVSGNQHSFWTYDGASGNTRFGSSAYGVEFYSNNTLRTFLTQSGNFLIGTTTDAGFKLDVNGTARFTGRIDAGTFTPGAAAALYTIATTGRINAAGGIYFRTPTVGDTALTGFNSSNNDAQINVLVGSSNVFYFSGAGGSTTPIAVATPNFNPSSGTADKNIFQVAGVYSTSGTYSGAIRGFYYNPNLVSMTGVTAHWAFHSTSGRVRFEGLPTSPTGLNAGDLYNDGGTLKIV